MSDIKKSIELGKRISELKEKVLETSLKMSRSGLSPATWGNVSAKDSESGLIVITPSGIPYEKIHPKDLCVVDLEGNIVDSRWKPSTELPTHLIFYRNKSWVNGVVHTHSIYATAFAALQKEIPVVVATLASGVGGSVPCAPYTKSGTEEFAKVALDAMGDKTAVLLGNHGVVSIGSTLDDAYTVAELVENAAKIYHIALTVGKPNILSDEEAKKIREKYLTKYGQK
ncbi:class II aldolase/adducin family protein [Sporanaerobacter sp. PP17-6a]|uniref:class II aldolase/adducin family protein n=1 Tax=Sporanaerobacter sp. PP17-6a TaxID=1891289 RepID=UPI00089FA3F6|nr:class II aldolase/adducin family protein [Sporanaerobacter sp. PP17-6a]SCL91573.1 L-fuculose phosphate aldolase [Sporanaerobacter sp. PP17-6a]